MRFLLSEVPAWRGDRKPEGERQREIPKEKETGRGRERKKKDKTAESIRRAWEIGKTKDEWS